MEDSLPGLQHGAEYLDQRLGRTHWGPLPSATQDFYHNSSNFAIRGDLDHVSTQQLAYQPFNNAMKEIENYPQLPFTGPSHVDPPYEHHRIFSQSQPEPQPLSMNHDPDLVDNDDTYTEFRGVYSPAILAPIAKNDSPYHCPRCGSKFTHRTTVKKHFPGCIIRHGNPDALRWNDHSSLKPLRKGGLKDQARTDKYHDTLQAYSGVVIPSKLRQGQAIVKFMSSSRQGNHLCAICGGGPFSQTYHVKSHFITCVNKYGNPTGANWYDRSDLKHIRKRFPGKSDAISNGPSTM